MRKFKFVPPAATRAGIVAVVLGLAATAANALAGGGNVLPCGAKAKGYSLTDAARATAVFNTGPHDAAPPKLPFYTLTGDATVKPGTTLYVPVFYADDSGAVEGVFPSDVTDQGAAADYLLGLVKDDFNVDAFIIVVDGKVTYAAVADAFGLEYTDPSDMLREPATV